MNTTEKNGNPLAELDNMYKLLDMHVEEARPEYSRVTMPITQKVKNGMGIAHGGAIFTLADIAATPELALSPFPRPSSSLPPDARGRLSPRRVSSGAGNTLSPTTST